MTSIEKLNKIIEVLKVPASLYNPEQRYIFTV
jgi:hypothetical protein